MGRWESPDWATRRLGFEKHLRVLTSWALICKGEALTQPFAGLRSGERRRESTSERGPMLRLRQVPRRGSSS